MNAVAGMILEYRAFDTFGESAVLFAAAGSTLLLLHSPRLRVRTFPGAGYADLPAGAGLLPAILLFGIYVDRQRTPQPRREASPGGSAGRRADPGLPGAGGRSGWRSCCPPGAPPV